MLNSFTLSQNNINNYSNYEEVTNDLNLYYEHQSIINKYSDEEKMIICYGYCFDVRKPERKVSDTLMLLFESDNFNEDLLYLNGHFIMIYNDGEDISFLTDATSFTPIYYSCDEKLLFPSLEIEENYKRYNPYMKLNLNNFSVNHIDFQFKSLKNKRIERLILDNVMYQSEYFSDKKFQVNFKNNSYGKTLLAIFNIKLINQNLYINMDEESLEYKNAMQIAKTYHMNLLTSQADNEQEKAQYVANPYLMNFNLFMGEVEKDKLFDKFIESLSDYEIDDKQARVEFNTLMKNHYNHVESDTLLYDPFNVRVIQSLIYYYDPVEKFNPFQRIITILQPTIDFFDFTSGKTVKQKYENLNKKYRKLKNEYDNMKSNTQFIKDSFEKGYSVSENFDGELIEDGIKLYPVKPNIIKDDIYSVNFEKKGVGLLFIETFFENEKNAHRIKVQVNDEIFNINEFLTGKFMNVTNEVNIKMWYERDYNAASWQKAGKLLIREFE